jgi:hypothetical protein
MDAHSWCTRRDAIRREYAVPLPRIATIGLTISVKFVASEYTVAAQASQPTAESLLVAIWLYLYAVEKINHIGNQG